MDALGDLVSEAEKGKEIALKYGGRISFRSTARPENLRSGNYGLIISDEHCFGEDIWHIIEPMTKRQDAPVLIISTPNGHNHGYAKWLECKQDPNWKCIQLPWTVCPAFNPAKMKETEARMVPSRFRSEYLAMFESPSGAIFPFEWLTEEKIFVSEMPSSPQRSCIGIDPSTGRDLIKGDYQAIANIRWKDGTIYVDMHAARMSIYDLCKKVSEIYKAEPTEGIALESNNFQLLIRDELKRHFDVSPRIYPIDHYGASKEDRVSRLSKWLARGELKILDTAGGRLLHHQLCDFGSKDCKHDDCPDALELAIGALART